MMKIIQIIRTEFNKEIDTKKNIQDELKIELKTPYYQDLKIE